MAFDAAAAAASTPSPGANASAKAATRQGDGSDPFGALLAMLDGAQTETDAAPQAKPAAEAPPAVKSEAEASDADADADEPVTETDAAPEAVSPDPAILVAAMMAPATPAQTQAPVAPVAETTVPAPLPAVAPVEAAAVDPAASDPAAPAPVDPGTAPVDPKVQADAEIAKPAPVAQAEPAETPEALSATPATASGAAPAQPAPQRLAAADKPAEPARAERVDHADTAQVDPNAAAPAHADAKRDGGRNPNRDDQRFGDAAAQQAQADEPAASAADPTTVTAAAEAAPEAPAPMPTPAQTAGPAPAASATAQAVVAAVRGSPETVAQMAAQMIQRLDGRTTRFDLTLNPQSLGRVDVRIEIGAKGALRARMAFDDASTAHELSGRHAELRAALQNAGFDVPEGALSFDVASGGGGAYPEPQDSERAAAPVFHNFADASEPDAATVVKNYFSAAGSTGVDIRV